MANRIAEKNFKSIAAIVVPVIAVLAYLGFNIVSHAKGNIDSAKKETASSQLELQNLKSSFTQINDRLKYLFNSQVAANKMLVEGNQIYSATYQKYIENLFTGYITNSQQLIEDVTDIKIIEKEYENKKAQFDENINSLVAVKKKPAISK